MAEYDLVGNMIAYEQGELDDMGTIELFASLVKSGMSWTLQGHYGRTASALIEAGVLSKDGEINYEKIDELQES